MQHYNIDILTHQMLPYIKEFTHRERLYYWKRISYKKSNTFCKIAVVLHSENSRDVGDVLSRSNPEPHDGKHIVVVALEHIVNDLKSKGLMIEDDSVVLDVIIRLHNNPCVECQKTLFDFLMEIKENAPNSHFRLIIFFSNFNDETKEGIGELHEWILRLIGEDVVVILCPLFVCTMVAMARKISKIAKFDRAERDQTCIQSFRELLSKIEGPESISVQISHDLFRESHSVFKSFFSWKYPHFISISPREIPKQLSHLFIDPEFFNNGIKDSRGRKRTFLHSDNSDKLSSDKISSHTAEESYKKAKYSID